MATESRQDCRVSGAHDAATAGASADRQHRQRYRQDREDIGLAHTLLFWYRCVAGLTQRSCRTNCETIGERGAGARRPALLCVAVAAIAAGCFNHPINRAPVVNDVHQVGQAGHGKDATFMASGSDPDQDPLTWRWATAPKDCPDASVPSNWPSNTSPGQDGAPATYVVHDSTLTASRYCVWAFATDRYGSVGANNLTVDPADNPPVAAIRIVTPTQAAMYPAYTSFQLSADDSNDPDNDSLHYSWKLQKPANSNAIFIPCPGETIANDDDVVHCFKSDVSTPYQYMVSLTVSDGTLSSTTTISLNVQQDIPPCIALTAPMYMVGFTGMASPSDSILVNSVVDDGDPKNIHFTWYGGKNDGPRRYIDSLDFKELTLSAIDNFVTGDIANVRVEVKDQNTDQIDMLLANCGDDAEFCTSPSLPLDHPEITVCYIRVSWRIVMQ